MTKNSNPSPEIEIARHRSFCIGNAIKHLWRAGLKMDEGSTPLAKPTKDLQLANWYINALLAPDSISSLP